MKGKRSSNRLRLHVFFLGGEREKGGRSVIIINSFKMFYDNVFEKSEAIKM